jgi:hypothetical protein
LRALPLAHSISPFDMQRVFFQLPRASERPPWRTDDPIADSQTRRSDMEIDKLQRSLASLGIPPSDYRMLKLLPLVYVAWADGKMGRVQKERIRAFAAKRYELSAAGAALLQHWLNHPPTHQYVTEGLRDILFLAKAQDDMGIDFSELPALLSYAEGIARSTGQALDAPDAVSPEEDRALEEVARELHIDHGDSWARVIQSLS